MSVIFGVYRETGSGIDQEWLMHLAQATVRYGPDSTSIVANGHLGVVSQAFRTSERSYSGLPIEQTRGNIVAIDGRLDNYAELATELGASEDQVSDSILVLKAFDRWGDGCFAHLIGDWALALWDAVRRVLYLAHDHAGSRTLYYRQAEGETTWSTHLETLLVGVERPEVDEEYLWCDLARELTLERTPYKGIRAVLPAHYVAIGNGSLQVFAHWKWIAGSEIVYRSDTDYDEHFISLFKQAVRRRLGSESLVLAELSGGVDSSAIVCMADLLLNQSSADLDRVNTVSYYDDAEPDWDERPYFTLVENWRGRAGFHIDCSLRVPTYEPLSIGGRAYPYPCGDRIAKEIDSQFEAIVGAGRFRVILSGIGGDELLGGVPTPLPELGDYLRAGRFAQFVTRAMEWGIATRHPAIQLLHGAATYTASLYMPPNFDRNSIPPWINARLSEKCAARMPRLESWRELLGARPSAIMNGRTWWGMLETLPHRLPRLEGLYEFRYPYLDRDLVEFLHRVPRAQLVQPGRRRLMMRRALKSLLPEGVLERRRKAFVSHAPLVHLRAGKATIEQLFKNSVLADMGVIVPDDFFKAFKNELTGDIRWLGHIKRTIELELWLRGFSSQTRPDHAASGNSFARLSPMRQGANKIRASHAVC